LPPETHNGASYAVSQGDLETVGSDSQFVTGFAVRNTRH
jgi:hypothetical protein